MLLVFTTTSDIYNILIMDCAVGFLAIEQNCNCSTCTRLWCFKAKKVKPDTTQRSTYSSRTTRTLQSKIVVNWTTKQNERCDEWMLLAGVHALSLLIAPLTRSTQPLCNSFSCLKLHLVDTIHAVVVPVQKASDQA